MATHERSSLSAGFSVPKKKGDQQHPSPREDMPRAWSFSDLHVVCFLDTCRLDSLWCNGNKTTTQFNLVKEMSCCSGECCTVSLVSQSNKVKDKQARIVSRNDFISRHNHYCTSHHFAACLILRPVVIQEVRIMHNFYQICFGLAHVFVLDTSGIRGCPRQLSSSTQLGRECDWIYTYTSCMHTLYIIFS